MKKLIVAVPTRNNAAGIESLMMCSLKTYRDFDIDVMIFDSSEDDNTQEVTEKYMKTFDNLFYQRFDSDFNLAQKMDAILSCRYFPSEYEYVWPIKDRNYVEAISLQAIFEEMESNPDAIVLVPGKTPKDVYSKPEELYRDLCSYITSLNVMIYNYSKVLKDYSFNDYPDTRGEKYLNWWSPYLYALHKFSKLENLNVHVIDYRRMRLIELDGLRMTWSRDIFEVWVDCWIKINEELPECYNLYKEECIKKVPNLPIILGSRKKLIELYENGILTEEKCERYAPVWNRVCDIPVEVLRQISKGDYDINHDFSIYDAIEIEMIQLVEKFVSLLDSGCITTDMMPVDDVVSHLKAAIHIKYERAFDVESIVFGSIDDISDILKRTTEKREFKKYLQILLNYYLMCGE